MNRYGQLIVFGTIAVPHLFTGNCTAYSYNLQADEQIPSDESGDPLALVHSGKKAALEFEAEIKDSSNNFLDLSAGAEITVDGITTGRVLAYSAWEEWVLKQPKKAGVRSTHYVDMPAGGSGASAGTGIDAFTPDQTGLAIIQPGSKVIFGTYGMTSTSGIVHRFRIEQELTIDADEEDPSGAILGAISSGYVRRITLECLMKTTSTLPAIGAELTVTGAPSHASFYRVKSVNQKWAKKRGKMVTIEATWISAFTS